MKFARITCVTLICLGLVTLHAGKKKFLWKKMRRRKEEVTTIHDRVVKIDPNPVVIPQASEKDTCSDGLSSSKLSEKEVAASKMSCEGSDQSFYGNSGPKDLVKDTSSSDTFSFQTSEDVEEYLNYLADKYQKSTTYSKGSGQNVNRNSEPRGSAKNICNNGSSAPEPSNVQQVVFNKQKLTQVAFVQVQTNEEQTLLENCENLRSCIDLNYADENGMTMLHWAVIYNNYARVCILIESGANPDVQDKQGKTPLHLAVEIEAVEIVKFLLEYVKNVNPLDCNHNSPRDYAYESGKQGIEELLKQHGGKRNCERL